MKLERNKIDKSRQISANFCEIKLFKALLKLDVLFHPTLVPLQIFSLKHVQWILFPFCSFFSYWHIEMIKTFFLETYPNSRPKLNFKSDLHIIRQMNHHLNSLKRPKHLQPRENMQQKHQNFRKTTERSTQNHNLP